VSGFGFRVPCFIFSVHGLGLRVQVSAFSVEGLEFRGFGLGFRVKS